MNGAGGGNEIRKIFLYLHGPLSQHIQVQASKGHFLKGGRMVDMFRRAVNM